MLSSLCAIALNNKGRKNDTALKETNGSDFDDDDDDEKGMFLPFKEMKRWLENKPRGFGEGKLKNDLVKTSPKKEDGKIKASEGVPSGFRVHLANLPKKKNIHGDLKSTF
ncbi:hypothetical protein ACOSQ2_018580 [Xanthoceras sorbifolium]